MSLFEQEPPQWALRFLRLYCKPRALEIIEGDAYELFYKRIEQEGLPAARRKFSWDVFRFFRLRYIKGFEDINSLNNIAMFKNYLKVSIRSLRKQRFYSLINISGLALGLAACLLIVMYITHEMSYDKFHKDSDRLYRMVLGTSGPWTPARLAYQSKTDLPEIEETARVQGPFSQTFNIDGKIFKEQMGFNADSTFHRIFTVQFIEGNPDEALKEPNSIILTQSLANKLFDYQSALGKLIKVDGETIKVTAVVADPPKNTHFRYNFINSLPHEWYVTVGNWTGNNFYSYAKLVPGAQPSDLDEKFKEFAGKYIGPDLIKFTGHASYEEYLADGGRARTFSLRPMVDLHLHYPRLALRSNGSIDNVYIFSAVALFILLIACINFMNLSTARSAMRSKEVGMRKVLGSLRGNLINQFLVESLLISLFAMVLALGISVLALDGFNELANRDFGYSDLFKPSTLIQLLLLVLVVGLLAGSYPAFVLSAFKPIKALRGEAKSGGKGSLILRKGLVSFQFAISIFLIISTTVVFRQLGFLSNQKLGFDADQVMVIKNGDRLDKRLDLFRTRVLQIPEVLSMTMSDRYLSGGMPDYGYQTIEDNPRGISLINTFATDDYLRTLGIELVEGRNFSNDQANDRATVLINEAAKKELGWTDVLGKKLSRGEGEDYTIVGVVKDFNFESLKRDIQPLVIRLLGRDGFVMEDWYGANYISLRVNGDFKRTVDYVGDLWNELVTDEPFDYVFLDESFNALYEEEERFGNLFTASSGLAIAIACLGLFALAAFTLERRYKELAVRKVLGASVRSLMLLVLSNFTLLVFIGALIAIPSGYLIMQKWLSDFAYQISLNNPLLWILPALAVALIAWLTVGFQSAKTAMSNPVNALRSE